MVDWKVRENRPLKLAGDCGMLGGEPAISPLKLTRKCDIISGGSLNPTPLPLKFPAKCDTLTGAARFGVVLSSPDTEAKTPHPVYHTRPSRAARPDLKLSRDCGMIWGEAPSGGVRVPSPLVSGLHAEPFLHHDNSTTRGGMWGDRAD